MTIPHTDTTVEKWEEYGILPDPNPYGKWVSIKNHNRLVRESVRLALQQARAEQHSKSFTEGYNQGRASGIADEKKWSDKRVHEAKAEGVKEAYTMFTKTIKDAKKKFPGHKEFEIVVDVRDIEKSLSTLNTKGEK